MTGKNNLLASDNALIQDIRSLIEDARLTVATTVNASLTRLYWRIGKRIDEEILKGDRAEYGEKIVHSLSTQLSQSYGSGFSYSALTRMIKFYESFQDEKIIATLLQQLSWSHFRELLPLEKPLQRDFYREFQNQLEHQAGKENDEPTR